MLLLIPYLFPSARLLETAAQGLHLPALQTLLARGTRTACDGAGLEAALCNALGVGRQQDWPLAPVTLTADGGVAAGAYWLRADPVHLRVMRDRIVLADADAISLAQDEADSLAATIAQHFGDGLRPQPLQPRRWYLRFADAPRLATTPLSVAVGRDIDPLLPQGGDAMHFRALLNELQMLLHDHPVNQAREARGELPVNSLWLWGGGTLPASPAGTRPVYADDAEAQALARFAGAPAQALPTQLDARLLGTNALAVLDRLTPAGQIGDAYGWRDAMRELEADWFRPLRGALHTIGPEGLRIADPVSGTALDLRPRHAWRVWRRSRSLAEMLSEPRAR